MERRLLHLEAKRVLVGNSGLQDLDRDLSPKGSLRLEPLLFAQKGLGVATRAELRGLSVLVEDEGVCPRSSDVRGRPKRGAHRRDARLLLRERSLRRVLRLSLAWRSGWHHFGI